MKAIVLHQFGGPEVLSYEDVPDPLPAPDEVLVAVHAVSVNQALDLMVRAGRRKSAVSLPHILGVDPAGTIVAVGADVEDLRNGDRVAVSTSVWCGECGPCRDGVVEDCASPVHIGVHRPGGYAELVAVPARNAQRLPDGLDFGEAAVIMRHAPTAWNLLRAKAGLRAGETVLVMGASGGLGQVGAQIAKLMGATVIVGARTQQRVAAAMRLGADHGVPYGETDLTEAVMELTQGRGVDVVFENIGDASLWPQAFASLAQRGRLVTAGAHGGGGVTLDVRRLYGRRLTVRGGGGCNAQDIADAVEAAASGRIKALIDSRMPLEEAEAAHRLAEAGGHVGKIVLEPQLSSS
jgi:NADPH:quinone reductase